MQIKNQLFFFSDGQLGLFAISIKDSDIVCFNSQNKGDT